MDGLNKIVCLLTSLKLKNLSYHFGKLIDINSIENIVMNGRTIERVQSFKLLGIHISADLSWDMHVDYLIKKVSKRFLCIRYLVNAGVRDVDIVEIYCSVIRSVLEYACPVWHPGLTVKLSKDIERVQKRCLRLIYRTLTYEEALTKAGLVRLDTRREQITKLTFEQMKDENHLLHYMLPYRLDGTVGTREIRNPYPFTIPIFKNKRYGRDLVPYCINKRY